MNKKVSYHIHTTISDGRKSAMELLPLLKQQGVTDFSFTDHDRIAANYGMKEHAKSLNMSYVNGVELSCHMSFEEEFDSSFWCHIVGLSFNLEKMENELDAFKKKKLSTIVELRDSLIFAGYDIPKDEYTDRLQLARKLVEKGYAKVTNDAFSDILNAEFLRFADSTTPTILEGIGAIHRAGGFAIWAHPFCLGRGGKYEITKNQVEGILKKMIGYGIDGIEVYYQKFSKEQILTLKELAKKYKLMASIATDYHGVDGREELYFELQGIDVDTLIVEEL